MSVELMIGGFFSFSNVFEQHYNQLIKNSAGRR